MTARRRRMRPTPKRPGVQAAPVRCRDSKAEACCPSNRRPEFFRWARTAWRRGPGCAAGKFGKAWGDRAARYSATQNLAGQFRRILACWLATTRRLARRCLAVRLATPHSCRPHSDEGGLLLLFDRPQREAD